MKYIAHKHDKNLLGEDAAEIAKVEMVAGVVGDLKGQVTMPCYTSGDRVAITANLLQKVKPIVAYLGEKSYLIGQNITYVDFILFEMCDLMNWISEGKLFEQNPTLEAYHDRIKNLPRLKQYYEDDTRCMKKPFNNKVAKLNNDDSAAAAE